MSWVLAIAVAASAALHLLLVVPRLPAPAVEPGEPLPDYPGLASPLGAVAVAALAALSALLIGPRPLPELVVWFGYLGAGAALAWVDLHTTYLPKRLTYLCAAQVALGLVVVGATDPWRALGALLGGVVAWALFHLLWRVSPLFGYGDVRLAAIIGAVGGTLGVSGWLTSFVLGTLVGALWGIAHTLARRRTGAPAHFPYGPSLWLGPVLAVALSGW